MFRNVHERALAADQETVWQLVASLSSAEDRLWPKQRWPAMRFDGPLGVGARGGHGPVRYEVGELRPPHGVVFHFTPEFAIRGSHRLEIEPRGQTTVLRHVIEGRSVGAMHLLWPLFFRPLHDELLEDALDRAEAQVSGTPWRPRPFPARVRLLRRLARPPQLRRKAAVTAADAARSGPAET